MDVIVVGAGIAGLLAARAISEANPATRLTILDSAPEPGGLLAGYVYPEVGLWFDCGTHIFRQTGVEGIDRILHESLPESQWLKFPRGQGDTVGSVFGGRLQFNTHFPDLRGSALRDDILAEMRTVHAGRPSMPAATGKACDTARNSFGAIAADRIVKPVLEGMFKRPAGELSDFALHLPGLTRLVLLDEPQWRALGSTEGLRHVVAHPEQRRLPVELSSPLTSFYPVEGGTRTLIAGMVADLTKRGAQFHCGSRIDCGSWDRNRRVAEVEIIGPRGSQIIAGDVLIWTAGLFPLARAMGVDISGIGFDRPMPHAILNLRFEQVAMKDLAYVIGMDPGCGYFRVTNYDAFARNGASSRLTVEILGAEAGSEAQSTEVVIASLAAIGAITEGARPIFSRWHKLDQGFPVPTLRNFAAVSDLRTLASAKLPPNVALCGIHAKDGLFFQKDVLRHVYENAIAAVAQPA
ncbi:MAG: NAD(P)-binding protein [Hyphomicrobiaceae bacterium]